MTNTRQLDAFDLPVQTERQKATGALASMESRRGIEVERLRKYARHFAHMNAYGKKYGIPYAVTADDVRTLAELKTRDRFDRSNNVMGTVFRVKYFEPTGEYFQSQTDGSRGNRIMIWRYLPDIKKAMETEI